MNSIIVSAPGKLMLFGEHAVVYNRPCLVTAVDQRMKVTVEVLETEEFLLEAPDVQITGYKRPLKDLGQGDMPKGVRFIEHALKNISKKHQLVTGFKIITNSEFSVQLGFGSSSASSVCTIKAISELMDLKLSEKEIFDLAYRTVIDVQGKGSGFDIAASVYGGTIHFVTGGEFIERLDITNLPLIVGYSGMKADTVTLMNIVIEQSEKYPEIIEEIYNSIEDVVMFARDALLANDWQKIGDLLNFNQGFLASLGVSTRKLEDMIFAARDAGAFGAKLSGAGGGDCMIAIAPENKIKEVEEAVTQAGGEIIRVKTNAEGVRVEE